MMRGRNVLFLLLSRASWRQVPSLLGEAVLDSLGLLFGLLGASWGSVGSLLGTFGGFLGPLGTLLEPFWVGLPLASRNNHDGKFRLEIVSLWGLSPSPETVKKLPGMKNQPWGSGRNPRGPTSRTNRDVGGEGTAPRRVGRGGRK